MALSQLLTKLTKTQLLATAATTASTQKMIEEDKASKTRAMEIGQAVPKTALTDSMVRKIAQSGLSLADIRLAHSRNGIKELFGEKDCAGKARVTRTTSVIKKLVSWLGAAPSQPSTPSQPSPAVSSQRSPATLAKYQRRKAEGYDLPDPDYLAWLAESAPWVVTLVTNILLSTSYDILSLFYSTSTNSR
eukprot:scpid86527/ scgid29113/ 